MITLVYSKLEVQYVWVLIKNSFLEVTDDVIKQHPRSKTKYWFNKKCK